jgi:glycerate dehydrogenase
MNKPIALFLDKASLYPDDLDFSVLDAVASWKWFDNVNVGDIQHALDTAEIIVTNKIELSSEVIESCGQLKLICVAATGVNNVDIAAANQQAIDVCNVRAYASASVVQHVFSLLLSLNRKLFSYHEAAANGQWSHSDFFCYFGEPFNDLEGKTLGIIGFGELGRSVAKVAECFGMKVLVALSHNAGGVGDSSEGRVDLTTLLSASDVVSLHCPLTESNRHMIGEEEFSLMKSDAILINTARGGLVDERALLNALKNKQIAAAALDVLDEEPPSINHELLNYRADNLIITPHVAWASKESRQRLVDEIAMNIRAFQEGQPRNIV